MIYAQTQVGQGDALAVTVAARSTARAIVDSQERAPDALTRVYLVYRVADYNLLHKLTRL